MKRRNVLLALASTTPFVKAGKSPEPDHADYENPYEEVDWTTWETIDSMSHQHQGTTDASRETFLAMGYRHFAFSNYYPSAPTALPESFRKAHPGITWAPNAEQHSFLDSGLHFNSLGSRLATGYGSNLSSAQRNSAPIEHRFEGLRVFEDSRPWEGVYRLDLRLSRSSESDDEAVASLTVTGARACDRSKDFVDEGPIRDRSFAAGNHTIYLRTLTESIDVTLRYDSEKLVVTQFRLMQGTNRPWREMFRAALDGEEKDGIKIGGLLYPNSGGITLNHPTGKRDDYLEMLDFDPRVLGIEVWNQLTSGFGSGNDFYHSMTKAPSHFYHLWDAILATGRRCWGFFVKDHNTYGRGRNRLLIPPLDALRPEQREEALLRAYRNGAFFGSVAAIACDDAGKVIAPYDHTHFRFNYIRLRRDDGGRAVAVEAGVSGNDRNLRPNVQIRFITEQGVVHIVDKNEGEFSLTKESEKTLPPRFVRIEAFAYPDTHRSGEPLNSEFLSRLDVAEISRLHDRYAEPGPTFFGNPAELRTPIPIVDLIFSQPILRVSA